MHSLVLEMHNFGAGYRGGAVNVILAFCRRALLTFANIFTIIIIVIISIVGSMTKALDQGDLASALELVLVEVPEVVKGAPHPVMHLICRLLELPEQASELLLGQSVVF